MGRQITQQNQAPETGKRGRKRKLPVDNTLKKNKTGDTKLFLYDYPTEHPFNKDGYRYILAEPDQHAPFWQEFDENPDLNGKIIPPWLYRAVIPSTVLLALHDRAPQIKLSSNRLTCTGEKGYSMVRATHSVNRGTWYYEAVIDRLDEGGAIRIGWALDNANLQACVGCDKFGYSWRSLKGTKFHEGYGKHFSCGYTVGDTLGILIHLPELKGKSYVPPSYKTDLPLVKFKSHLYYEENTQISAAINALKPLKGSRIEFYKNGELQGVAYEDIHTGSYFPAVSLFKTTTVTVNFGPMFKHSPKGSFRPMCDRAEEAMIEQTMADTLFLTQSKGKLKLN